MWDLARASIREVALSREQRQVRELRVRELLVSMNDYGGALYEKAEHVYYDGTDTLLSVGEQIADWVPRQTEAQRFLGKMAAMAMSFAERMHARISQDVELKMAMQEVAARRASVHAEWREVQERPAPP